MKELEALGRIIILILLLYFLPAKYAFYVFIAFRFFDLIRLLFYSLRFDSILKQKNPTPIPKAADAHLKTMPQWQKLLGIIAPLIIFAFVFLYLIDPDSYLNNYVPPIDISGISGTWFRRVSIAFLSLELLYFWLKIHYKYHRSFWYLTADGVLDYEKKNEKIRWADLDSFSLNEKKKSVELYRDRLIQNELHIVQSEWKDHKEAIAASLTQHLKLQN